MTRVLSVSGIWRDFVALLPRLDAEQVAWLRDAITLAYPEHPWLDALSYVASLPRSGIEFD